MAWKWRWANGFIEIDKGSGWERPLIQASESTARCLSWLPYVQQASKDTGVPAQLILGVMYVESRGKSDAVSWTGCCYGLMQINLGAHGVTKEQALDPAYNVTLGATILSDNMIRSKNDVPTALSMYVCGGPYKRPGTRWDLCEPKEGPYIEPVMAAANYFETQDLGKDLPKPGNGPSPTPVESSPWTNVAFIAGGAFIGYHLGRTIKP